MKLLTEKQKFRALRLIVLRDKSSRMRKVRVKERKEIMEARKKRHIQMLLSNGMIADSDANRRPIILPEVLSFWDNYAETAKMLADIRKFGLEQKTPLSIRFDNLKQLDPSAALVLVAEIFRCQKLRVYRNEWFITGNYSSNRDIDFQLSQMGFYNLLHIHDNLKGSKPTNEAMPVYLKFITQRRIIGQLISAFVGVVEDEVIKFDATAREMLIGAMMEAIGNADEHAYKLPTKYQSMKHRWYLSARINIAQREIMVMVYDQGVGIPDTLKPSDWKRTLSALVRTFKLKGPSPSDGEIIKLATEMGRTGTGEKGRGQGFLDMKRFVDKCDDGELRVLSKRGRYTYMKDNEDFDDQDVACGGTVVEWRFKSNDPLIFGDIK